MICGILIEMNILGNQDFIINPSRFYLVTDNK